MAKTELFAVDELTAGGDSAAARPAAPSSGSGARRLGSRGMSMVEVVAIFRRRLLLFGTVFVGTVWLCAVGVVVAVPKYTAVAELKIDPNQRSTTDAQQGPRTDQVTTATIDTELEIAKSRQVAATVIQKLRLTESGEFSRQAIVKRSPLSAPARPDTEEDILNKTINVVLKRLEVERKGPTYMVDVKFTSVDPKKAATVANAFADEFIAASAAIRLKAIDAQSDALGTGLRRLEKEARSADQTAASFRAGSGLVAASSGSTVTQQQATTIAGQLSIAQADLATARANLTAARSQDQVGNGDAVAPVLSSPVIQDLRRQRAELLRERSDISVRYGPKHPDYLKVQDQLQALDQQLVEERQRVLSSLQATESSAEERVASLQNSLDDLQRRLNASSSTEAVAAGLDREALAKQNIYNQYSLAQEQASQQKNLYQPQAVVVTPASEPLAPSFPNKPLFGALGLIVGFILASCAVLVVEQFSPRLRNMRDVEDILHQPFIAAIPLITSRRGKKGKRARSPEQQVVDAPLSAFAESFRTVKRALWLTPDGGGPSVVAITSALPDEGKTTTSLAFARVVGMGGVPVVVVDCDLRRGALRRSSGRQLDVGLEEVLMGTASLDTAVVRDEVENVSLLPLSRATKTPLDLLGSPAFADVIAQLRKRFVVVILDTPPVLAVSDALEVSRQADTVLMLCRWSHTRPAAVATALSMLERDGVNVAGVALTMVDYAARSNWTDADSPYYQSKMAMYYQD